MKPIYLTVGISAMAVSAFAVEREPHIGYIYPAGGRVGTTFEAVIGGFNLNDATTVRFSGTGVTAEIIKQERQVTPVEQQQLKERLAKLQEKRRSGTPLTAEEQKSSADMISTLTHFGRRLANPSLGEFVTLRVTIAPDAAPGEREIRLGVRLGVSNPRLFGIGETPEFSKHDWKNVPKSRKNHEAENNAEPPPVDITLPATLTGQISPGCLDKYRFTAKTGQRLVVDVRARALIPYLADAVPGWLQATATLRDAQGKEVAYADDYWFRPDPVIFYKIPNDGQYTLEIHDALYRGREDFVYRILIGELPFVTGMLPMGGRIGSKTNVTLTGWNLPNNHLTVDLTDQQPGILMIQPSPLSNRVPFAMDALPEDSECEPNDARTNARAVTLPVIINGHIDDPGDVDVFRFAGHAGQKIVAEVMARRLDSPLDSVLMLLNHAGDQLATNDDQEDKASGLNTHHADSYLAATLPADGDYYICIGDTQHGGGAAFGYRLRLSAPRPDFELRFTPSSLNVRGGTSVAFTAYALRKDGFDGEISLSLTDAPSGFKLDSAVIPAHQNQMTCTLTAPAARPPKPGAIHVTGKATIQGHEVVRTAVPADDATQAFAYHHLVPARELILAVGGLFRPGDANSVLSPTPLRIPAGGSQTLKVQVPLGPNLQNLEFELVDPPPGISLGESSASSMTVLSDRTKVKAGQSGNLIVTASAVRKLPLEASVKPAKAASPSAPATPTTPTSPAKTAVKRRVPLGALPAIPYQIVAP